MYIPPLLKIILFHQNLDILELYSLKWGNHFFLGNKYEKEWKNLMSNFSFPLDLQYLKIFKVCINEEHNNMIGLNIKYADYKKNFWKKIF